MAQYTIKNGDTLWDIAKNNNTTVEEIQKANPNIKNPNLIYSGNVINLPDAQNSNPQQTTSPTTNNTQQNGQQTTNPTVNNNTATSKPQYKYDASTDAAYQQAIQALQQAQNNMPTYGNTYDQQINDIYNQIVNRDKFQYDINSDMLYQQYAEQYANKGKLAMKDTMGQAAALTGGYGNSYAQSVGQQQYDAYLQQLNDVVPELYGMAYDQYEAENEQLMNQYAMLGDMRDDEYGRYQDALNAYWQNVNYLTDRANDAYNQGYESWYNSYQMGLDADKLAYDRQNDAYDRLVSLITTTGYMPTAEELAAAGMPQGQADAYKGYYTKNNTPVSSGVGPDRYYSPPKYKEGTNPNDEPLEDDGKKDPSGLTSQQIRDLQYALRQQGHNIEVNGDLDSRTKTALQGLSADEAYNKYVKKATNPSANIMEDIESIISNGHDKDTVLSVIQTAYDEGNITKSDKNMLEKYVAKKFA